MFVASVTVGALFTASTVILKVCTALVSTPLFAVPPLSRPATLIIATPLELTAGVKVTVPFAATAGWLLKSPLLLLETMNATVSPDSFAGPVTMFVARLAKLLMPEFS